MKLLIGSILLVAFVGRSCSVPADPKWIEVHDVDSNDLTASFPYDPAHHSFPTVPSVPVIPTCIRDGYYRDPFNCAKFYHCKHKDSFPMAFYCRSGLMFNMETNYCDYPQFVIC